MPQSRNNKSSNNLCLHSFFIFCTILIQCVPASLTFSWFVCFISALDVAICANPVSLLAFYPGPIKAAPLHILTTAATFLTSSIEILSSYTCPWDSTNTWNFYSVCSALQRYLVCNVCSLWMHQIARMATFMVTFFFFLPVFTSLNAFFLPSCCFRSLRGWMCFWLNTGV